MGVHGAIYFANIKSDYKWAYLQNILVFSFQKADRIDFAIVFWDIKSEQRFIHYRKNLVEIKGCQDFCVIITKLEDQEVWLVELCNSIGSPLDSKLTNIEPLFVKMTKTHVVISNNDYIYIWQYRNQV